MEESAELYKHRKTGEIYAIRRKWNGDLVGGAGPLTADDFKNIKHILTTPDLNHWIETNARDLILYDYDFDIADELQETWQYINELTESLYGFDHPILQSEYTKLYDVIEGLMKMTFETKARTGNDGNESQTVQGLY
jgi:hypothetical protein